MIKNFKYPFIRVRTTYYKLVKKPLLSGDFIETLVPWTLEIIKQDYGTDWREVFKSIPKYDGFCNIPSHTNYQRSFNRFYNQYEPLVHLPKEGEYSTIYNLLEH